MSHRTFSVLVTLVLLVSTVAVLPAGADHTARPSSVTIAGSLQRELGCPGDWQPECAATHLASDAADEVWQGTFSVPAGDWEYKAALSDSWDESYGLGGGGNNIPLSLGAATDVKFYYDHETHWATDNVNSVIATVAGSFQSELGCPGDWQPDCLRSWLQDKDGDGAYEFATSDIPAGSYEFKVALNEAWDTSYPASNAAFSTAGGELVTFTFDAATTAVDVTVDSAPPPAPSSVAIAGSLQSELGCPGDWQPECAATELAYDAGDDVWQAVFDVPAGAYEYKAALEDSWDENYGGGGVRDGANIPLSLAADTSVKFFYDHGTHWVTDNVNSIIATAPGSFQSELGCPGDWQPDCLRSWLQDPDGDGVYEFTTDALPAGSYEGKVAVSESWDENYGAGGTPGGDNIPFTVAATTVSVTFTWDSITKVPTITVDDGDGLEPGDAELVTAPVRQPGAGDTIYFVLTDRFEDGSDANDTGADTSGDPLFNGYLVDDKGYYHGGDLAGLTSRIDYLVDLGITAVWMTPPFTNDWVQGDGTIAGSSAGYHGYWQTDYENVDPHLGTNQEMKDFIDAAHAAGIKVYFDVVINHTGDIVQYAEGATAYVSKADQPYRDASGNVFDDRDFAGSDTFPPLDPAVSFPYTPTLVPGDETVKNPAWLNDPIYYHNRGNSSFTGENSLYGDFFGLDDLFTEHPDVVNGMIEIHQNMITEFGIDGFRVDTVKHVNDEMWEAWVPAILEYATAQGKPDFVLFGEVFGESAEFRARYSTELPFPATLDFGFDGAATDFAASSAPTSAVAGLFAQDDYYTDVDSNAYGLVKFMGNHDVGRIGLDIVTSNPGASDDELVARAVLAQALNLFTRGTPVIYYGDEQGFVGDGGDKDARQDMLPSQVASYNDDDLIGTDATTADSNFDATHPIYAAISDMTAVRAGHSALQSGAQLHRYAQDTAGIFAFSRIDRAEQVEYIVALNNSESEATATFATDSPDTSFAAVYPAGAAEITTSGDDFTVTVPGLSFVVYRAMAEVATSAEAPAISVVEPESGTEVTGLVAVVATVGGGDYAEVTFAVSVDGGDYEVIGVDDGAPYRVFHDVSGYPVGTDLTFKAIVRDLSGNLDADKTTVAVGEEEEPPIPGGDVAYAIIHYFRSDGDYGDHTTGNYNDFWGLHLWGDAIDPSEVTEWTSPKPFLGEDGYGRFAWVKLADPTQPLNFIVHRGDLKDGTDADRSFLPGITPEIWLKQDDGNEYANQAAAQAYVTIHYHRPDGDYGDPASDDYNDFWGLHLWGDAIDSSEGTEWTAPKKPTGFDDYGAYWEVLLADPTAQFNYIIHRGDDKDPGPDEFFTPAQQATVWKQSMDEALYRSRAAAENAAVIHYHRPDGDYGDPTSDDFNDFWGLHVWTGAAAPNPSWQEPVRPAGQDMFGIYFEVPLVAGATELAYIIHRGDAKDPGPDQFLQLAVYGHEVWQLSGADPDDPYIVPIMGGGGVSLDNLDKQQAFWVDEKTIVWPLADDPTATYTLHWSEAAALIADESGIGGGDGYVELTPAGTFAGVEGFLHLDGMPALQIAPDDRAVIPAMLKGQVAVAATSANGVRIDATGLQIPGVLDDLFAYDGDLGVTWDGAAPTIKLWAPTAQSVTFHLFDDAAPATTSTASPMVENAGVWSIVGDASWDGKYYLYEVEVYAPTTGQIETNIVTDPYSLSLAMNSARSQIVDLTDPGLAPEGWSDLAKPEVAAPEDITLYELHIRDFSAGDDDVPADVQGTFKAFTLDTAGTAHLESLADAGLTHVHLLPAFDIATINENKAEWQEPDPDLLATYPPDSDQQQAAVTAVEDLDGFNWGYDPWHYTVPEGSYSTNPDGTARIVEFREMVQSLNETGLRVVMDVVYNHTNASGQAEKSVLDRIVPGYYHRLNADGAVETSTCCANTATEHAMMEKLMVDSLITWARDYKVDGFRFDLMGHHSLANMLEVQAALQAIDPDIYLYGEGWNFGEVANDTRFTQATQLNLAGTGIGTFNDRLRDAVRGGGPFDDGQSLRINQGVINGLWYDPNEVAMPEAAALGELLLSADQIRVGLAGNLAGYEFVDRNGNLVKGSEVDYNGSPAGYTGDPQEHIIYVSAHDNQTLFDIGQYHHPTTTSMDDRVRAQNLGIDFTILSQGVPFFHAGVEMLRSKSMDRDSYNSGDWFNEVDFTYQSNNWAVGLPVAGKNQSNWPVIQPLLANPALAPGPADIVANVDHFREMLAIRNSSPLFRLQSEHDVMDRVVFHNTGPSQIPGVIVMSISDQVGADLDPDAVAVFAVFNSVDEPLSFTVGELAGLPIGLHPVQAASADAVVQGASFDASTGTFTVPARTTAIFVQAEPDTEAPEVTAELAPIQVHPHFGFFRVQYSCSDDRDPSPSAVATLNEVPVTDGLRVFLIETRRRVDHLRVGAALIMWAPEFELVVTCTDAAGNAGTATAIAEFAPPRWPPWR